ncbi:glycine-rich domain-containing protein [Serratia fonticola]
MQSSSSPKKIPTPFASEGDKREIPITTNPIPGAASYTDGFPPLTRLALSAGGVPPSGFDFNGVFNDITNAIRWLNAGSGYSFDSEFSSSIGGYPKGAILLNSAKTGFWMSSVENNTANPDSGGAGWSNPIAGRLLRTSVYTVISGSQFVSVNGGAITTTGASSFAALSLTKSVEIECQAGGSGGGGVQANGSQPATAGGGGAGAYARALLTSGFSSLSVTVGSGGNGGAPGNNYGSVGGVSSVGSVVACPAGFAGPGGTPQATPFFNGGTAFSQAPTGATVYAVRGGGGGYGTALGNSNVSSGIGGSSNFGEGSPPATNGPGINAVNYGSGGSGAALYAASITSVGGGNGAPGIVIIREYA